jgi:hypothetical protein
MLIGAPLLQLVELDKFVITRGYPIRYYKVKTDFALLAKKRWISGESITSLAKYFEVHEDTIKGYLRLLKDRKKLLSLGFSEGEIQILYEGINKERNNEGLILSSV